MVNCATEHCLPPTLSVFVTFARFCNSLSSSVIRPAIALLYNVSSSTFGGFGVATGLKSQEKQSEHRVTELSQEPLELLELLLLELSVVEMTELLVVAVLVIEGSPDFAIDGPEDSGPPGPPGPPRPPEESFRGGNGEMRGMGGIGGPPGPSLELESGDCTEEDELVVTRRAVVLDRSLDVIDTGIAVVFGVLADVIVVLMSDIATVALRVEKRLALEDKEFKVTEVEGILTGTVVGGLDSEKMDTELVIDTMLLVLRPTVGREDETSVIGLLMFTLSVIILEGGILLRELLEDNLKSEGLSIEEIILDIEVCSIMRPDEKPARGTVVFERIDVWATPVLTLELTDLISEGAWLLKEYTAAE